MSSKERELAKEKEATMATAAEVNEAASDTESQQLTESPQLTESLTRYYIHTSSHCNPQLGGLTNTANKSNSFNAYLFFLLSIHTYMYIHT